MAFGTSDAMRVAILGNYAPRRCGIATFTEDLYRALREAGTSAFVVAMDDGSCAPGLKPQAVRWTIPEAIRGDYVLSGVRLDTAADVLLVQHEFGIFGGECGDYLLDLLKATRLPVVTTLHTVLADPSPKQEAVLRAIAARSQMLVVMAERGRQILVERYGVPVHRIAVIAHGIPDRPRIKPSAMRARLGWPEVPTVLSFGLLSPGKGLETMIDALPRLIATLPGVRYIILGATHPHIVKRDGGEAYRGALAARAAELGVEANVRFVNSFVSLDELCDFLQASDVYVTPYLSPAQITSGTLAYACGLGVPVVSTRYVHALELLGHRPPQLVDAGCPDALGEAVGHLLTDGQAREEASVDAYLRSRGDTWPRVGRRYAALLHGAVQATGERRTATALAVRELRSNAA